MIFSFRRYTGIFVAAALFSAFAGYAFATTPAAAPDKNAGAGAAFAQAPWAERCDKDAGDKKDNKKTKKSGVAPHCEIYSVLSLMNADKKTSQRVSEFAVGYTAADKTAARGVLILPLGILLTDDLHMSIDSGNAFKFKVRFCASQGCFAFLDINQPVMDMLKKADAISIDTQTSGGQKVVIKIQMKGFAQALAKL